VNAHAAVSLTVYEQQADVHLRTLDRWIEIPGVGYISAPSTKGMRYLWWRSALRYPAERFVYCVRDADHKAYFQGDWSGYADTSIHITPVVSMALWERNGFTVPESGWPEEIDGDFIVERPIGVIHRQLDIPAIRLADYVVKPPQ
jgi:hypothetical protein